MLLLNKQPVCRQGGSLPGKHTHKYTYMQMYSYYKRSGTRILSNVYLRSQGSHKTPKDTHIMENNNQSSLNTSSHCIITVEHLWFALWTFLVFFYRRSLEIVARGGGGKDIVVFIDSNTVSGQSLQPSLPTMQHLLVAEIQSGLQRSWTLSSF